MFQGAGLSFARTPFTRIFLSAKRFQIKPDLARQTVNSHKPLIRVYCKEQKLPDTFVPVGKDGAEGLYFNEDSSFARSTADSLTGLRSWEEWYQAPWWLQQGDLMTIFASLGRYSEPVDYDRHLVETPDGGSLALDILRSPVLKADTQGCSDVYFLLISGLGGNSQGGYVRNMALSLKKKGYSSAVLNMRGCGNSLLKTPRTYSAYRGSTDDVRTAVTYLRKKILQSENYKIFLIGWSLGGNIITNTLADQTTGNGYGHSQWSLVDAGAALCPPHCLQRSSKLMNERWLSRHLYNRQVTRNLVSIFASFAEMWKQGPVACWVSGSPPVHIDVEMFLSASRIYEVDESLVRRMFGYRTPEEYYYDASLCRRLDKVRKPLLLISAADDPICGTWIPIDEVRSNHNLILAYTKHGGHVAWQDAKDARRSGWVESAVISFFEATMQRLPALASNASVMASQFSR